MVPKAHTGGPRFAAFCEHYIRHTKGRWAREPLVLEDWQRAFWWEALEVDPATGLRVYSEVGLGLPRKNGKSVQASAAGLYFLVADGEAEPEVYVAAAARNQAGIVLGQSRRMAQQSPRLSRHVSVRTTLIERPRNGGVMRSLSAEAALQHGLNPYANIIDDAPRPSDRGPRHRPHDRHRGERAALHALDQHGWGRRSRHPRRAARLYVRRPRRNPLEDRGSLLIYRDRANGVLIWWYGAPRDADIEDPAVWLAANPASWLRDGTYLSQEYARLKARGALLDCAATTSTSSSARKKPGCQRGRGPRAVSATRTRLTCSTGSTRTSPWASASTRARRATSRPSSWPSARESASW